TPLPVGLLGHRALGATRTRTVDVLNVVPLPIGLRGRAYPGRDSNPQPPRLERGASASWATRAHIRPAGPSALPASMPSTVELSRFVTGGMRVCSHGRKDSNGVASRRDNKTPPCSRSGWVASSRLRHALFTPPAPAQGQHRATPARHSLPRVPN